MCDNLQFRAPLSNGRPRELRFQAVTEEYSSRVPGQLWLAANNLIARWLKYSGHVGGFLMSVGSNWRRL